MFSPFRMIESELEQMHNYLNTVHSLLEEHVQKFTTSMDEAANHVSDKEKDRFDDYYSDTLWELDSFPKQLYSSFVVSWYSFVEHQLIHLCERLDLTITVRIQDRKDLGTGIHRAKKFLKEAKDYTIDNEHWKELNSIAKIRNKIAHGSIEFSLLVDQSTTNPVEITRNGETYYIEIEQDLYRYLDERGIFVSESRPSINITFDYCQHLVTFGKIFFSKIGQDLKLTSVRDKKKGDLAS
ncbi:MAG: hypothetical protein MUD01_07270 [Chloroflexaceae bacterium]|nr:hypothetical protein [Chloroflexaceae bacterium]